MMRLSLSASIVVFVFCACDVLVPGTGKEHQPCFADRTCLGALQCSVRDDTCLDTEGDCAGIACGRSPIHGFNCWNCPGVTDTCIAWGQGGQCEDGWVAFQDGNFMMGSATGKTNEQPVHQVSVPAFEITRTEVTVGQFQACVAAGVCSQPGTGDDGQFPVPNSPSPGGACNWAVDGRGDYPINCVSFRQAEDFCAYAGGRLPSEAEWEYAARGGGQDITYPWGDQNPTCQYAVITEGVGGDAGCGEFLSWAVCSKPDGNTAQGLCDMTGNLWEYVQDYYHPDYNGAPVDGSAWMSPANGFERQGVSRGGCFSNHYDYYDILRAAYRGGAGHDSRGYETGFRCAR